MARRLVWFDESQSWLMVDTKNLEELSRDGGAKLLARRGLAESR
jgi:hypothetical protein